MDLATLLTVQKWHGVGCGAMEHAVMDYIGTSRCTLSGVARPARMLLFVQAIY